MTCRCTWKIWSHIGSGPVRISLVAGLIGTVHREAAPTVACAPTPAPAKNLLLIYIRTATSADCGTSDILQNYFKLVLTPTFAGYRIGLRISMERGGWKFTNVFKLIDEYFIVFAKNQAGYRAESTNP